MHLKKLEDRIQKLEARRVAEHNRNLHTMNIEELIEEAENLCASFENSGEPIGQATKDLIDEVRRLAALHEAEQSMAGCQTNATD